MARAQKKGEITFRFYEYPDGTWKVATVVHKKHLPDMDSDPRSFAKMALMAAQVRSYIQKQMVALDTLLVGKEEIRTLMAEAKQNQVQADADKYQTKLPFEEENLKCQKT